jgi:hypothetical protein
MFGMLLKGKLREKKPCTKNLEQLKVTLQEERTILDDEFADWLVRSMKRRCKTVIKDKGSATEYRK